MPGCPELVLCTRSTTSAFFKNVCIVDDAHLTCFHYCSKRGLVMKPVEWLRRLAVLKETPSWDRRALEERYAIKR